MISGYDFGYLLRLLTNKELPEDEGAFFELLSCFFAKIYDVKYLMKSCKNLKGGLQEVADQLKVRTDHKWLHIVSNYTYIHVHVYCMYSHVSSFNLWIAIMLFS